MHANLHVNHTKEIIINDKKRKPQGPRINGQIKVSEVRLIGADGDQHGVVSIHEAKRMAENSGLDLVEVSPTARPPVAKIIDYGKYKYELQKKQAESKKKQSTIVLKEIQFRPNIEGHDLQVKLKKAKEFFERGAKIKMIMQFKGREMAYKQAGFDKFNTIIEDAKLLGGVLEAPPKMMGPRIIAIMSSNKAPKAVPVKNKD